MTAYRFLTSASAAVGLSMVAGRAAPAAPAPAAPGCATVLGIEGSRFTLNQTPTFLLGFSAYGALGASEASLRRDLDEAARLGFNWLRIWATWSAFGDDVSAVAADGQAREPYFGRLQWLVAECARRGWWWTSPWPAPGRPPAGRRREGCRTSRPTARPWRPC